MVRVVAFDRLTLASVNTRLPPASRMPELALIVCELVKVTAVPLSAPRVCDRLLTELRAAVTPASLIVAAPLTVPPPETVNGPGFDPGSGSGVRPLVFDAPEKRILPLT